MQFCRRRFTGAIDVGIHYSNITTWFLPFLLAS